MTHEHTTDWTGRVLRLEVAGPAHGGEFVARHEGRVVFCRGGITGETVDVLVEDDPGRAFCRGTVQSVIDVSPHRVETACPAAAAGTGCCDWSHIEPAAARGFAGRILAEQAVRIGRIDPRADEIPVEAPAGDATATGWRTVARWVTGPDGRPGVRRARSRDLVMEPCVQPDPRILDAVTVADVGPGRELLGLLGDDGTVHVAHRPAVRDEPRGQGSRARRSAATRARARRSRAADWEFVTGGPDVVRRVGEREWRLPPEAFWQAHRSAATHYASAVRTAVAQAPGLPDEPVVWDLYGGAGLFAAAVREAVPGADVTVVESSSASLGAVSTTSGSGDPDTASAAGPGVHTVRSRVETFLEDHALDADARRAPDVVVLDPPRGGAGIPVMQRLAEVARSRIVHVGCDAASLARDVGALVAAGWTLTDLRGVAAFPGTHHVEGIAVLDAPVAR
ncbi:class I SAM-dependent RNA methyltransferase [Dietzia cinnamea]|uniref:class I SAM-dependent RNA methyltransferase n=1 Tax=Dietzia cinnamea TaxID=321318 RepID=UPI0021A8D5FC|nr:TRAM domain-containing protein [Dietzia cinnamea]MCT2273723.1 TRAM domain-containing protein [Dietzia cinnamea]